MYTQNLKGRIIKSISLRYREKQSRVNLNNFLSQTTK